MRVKNEDLLDQTGFISMASSFDMKPVWLGHIAYYSIQLVFIGTPTGNFKLQASNDLGSINSASESNQDNDILNWTDIADSAQAITAGGDHMWTVENAGYNWVRVVWTQTAGTGTLISARCYVKGV